MLVSAVSALQLVLIAHCSTPLQSAPRASATACRTCWFSEAYVGEAADNGHVHQHGAHDSPDHVPRTTLLNLERTIQQRREAMLAKTGALGWLLPCLYSHPCHQGTAAQGLVKGTWRSAKSSILISHCFGIPGGCVPLGNGLQQPRFAATSNTELLHK